MARADEPTSPGHPHANDRPLYGEPQQGGLCQMHALNAYFGRRVYTPESFRDLCVRYDKAAGQPPGTSDVASPAAGFFGSLGVIAVVARADDGSAARTTSRVGGSLFKFALADRGDPFDEALGVSADYESPAAAGTRRTSRGGRAPGAWTRPRLDPARVARDGVRAVFVFDVGHVWVWRYGASWGSGDARGAAGVPRTDLAWHRIDSLRAGGAPQRGNPSGEWNGGHNLAIAVPRSYRPPA
jgi:hypothetical protein